MQIDKIYKKQRHIVTTALVTMAVIFMSTLGLTYYFLWEDALTHESKQLQAMVLNEAFLLDAYISSHEHQNSFSDNLTELEQTIKPVLNQLKGFGQSGEFVVGLNDGQNIRFLSSFRFETDQSNKVIPLTSEIAEPMRHALANKVGWVRGLDYRSEMVIAAYTPVGNYPLGLVAKLDASEIQQPFIVSAIKASVLAFALILLGGILIIYMLKPAMKEIEQGQANLLLLIKSAPDAMIVVNNQGYIVNTNEKFTDVFGYQEDEIVDQLLEVLIPPDLREKHRTHLQSYLANPTSRDMASGIPLHGLTKSGHQFPAEISLSPIKTNDETLVVAAIRDITDRKNLQEQFLQSQKMEALGKLTGGIAHDFNNLLAIIIGYSQMLQLPDKTTGNEAVAKYANQISAAGNRGASLVKRLLAFSKKQSIEPEVVDINKSLLEHQEMFEKALTARIPLIYDLSHFSWHSLVDTHELVDAILNMVLNAKMAMEEKAGENTLTIKTKTIKLSHKDSSALNIPEGDYMEISIIDTGRGMPEDVVQKIFEPFYTTKEEGTGLGLSQVFGFVSRAGGAVKAFSELNQGSQFVLYLPRVEAKSKDHTMSSDTAEVSGSESILIVDDELVLLELLEIALSDNGYTTYTATNGIEALNVMAEHQIDCVLTDVIMPEMDGYQLCAEIMKDYPSTKLQLMSGYSDIYTKDMIDPSIHENMISKPIDITDLLIRIRHLLDS